VTSYVPETEDTEDQGRNHCHM